MTAETRDKLGRPVIAVTGIGVVTSLGVGKAANWAKLTGGVSGIRQISRFPTAGLRTTIAGTVNDVYRDDMSPAELSERVATLAGEEAIAEAAIGGKGHFPGPLFLAPPPLEIEWPERIKMAEMAAPDADPAYPELLRVAREFAASRRAFKFGIIGERLAEKFGTEGSPISLNTACASGASAIQLGMEAIRRGECQAALAIGADASLTPELLVRFSLLSALSTQNDPPERASKPFSKNRDGFVLAEGAAALVLEDFDHAKARGARVLGILEGVGEKSELVPPHQIEPGWQTDYRQHAQRAHRRRRRARRCGLHQRTWHFDAGERQDGALGRVSRLRRADSGHPHFLQQIDDRPHPLRGGRRRSRLHAPYFAKPAHSSDHQPQRSRSRDNARCRA